MFAARTSRSGLLLRGTLARHMSQTASAAALLGLPASSPLEEVRKAYLRRAKDLHPDSSGGGSGEQFIQLQQAWEDHERRVRANGGCTTDQYTEVVGFTLSSSRGLEWTEQHVECMRSAITRAVQQLKGEDPEFEAPTLRRLKVAEEDTLALELATKDPEHRDSLASAIDSNAGTGLFLEHLRRSFVAAGGPEAMALRLKGSVRWHTSGGGAKVRPRVMR
tara:strand:- start:698 stop:1357 length:660 start_codon:yes stop_codon:yes gene_type:complete